ncbi:MAG: hypothetical protein V4529_17440 [Gemmatimonadota bacterium]
MQRRTQIAQKTFLAMLERTANITASAEAAGVTNQCIYLWQEKSDEFAAACQAARESAYDRLEAEALRRAVDGVVRKRPIVVGREVVDYEIITEYSDRLLEVLLKACRPDKYRERQSVEHSGPGGTPIAFDAVDQRSALADRIASLVARIDPPPPD